MEPVKGHGGGKNVGWQKKYIFILSCKSVAFPWETLYSLLKVVCLPEKLSLTKPLCSLANPLHDPKNICVSSHSYPKNENHSLTLMFIPNPFPSFVEHKMRNLKKFSTVFAHLKVNGFQKWQVTDRILGWSIPLRDWTPRMAQTHFYIWPPKEPLRTRLKWLLWNEFFI